MQSMKQGSSEKGLARVCIIGGSGSGKTRLAASFPDPLFINLEPNGPASALPGGVWPSTINVPLNAKTSANVGKLIGGLSTKRTKVDEDGLPYFMYTLPGTDSEVKVKTVVLESLDFLQQTIKYHEILNRKSFMGQKEWGKLLDIMSPIVMSWSNLPVHFVATAHTKEQEEDATGETSTFALQGGIRTQLPGWFSIILHTVISGGGMYVVSNPVRSRGKMIMAKDRHGVCSDLLNDKGVIDITTESGWPDEDIARAICGYE